ncbi:MAG: polysaccharide deacetylase family protein [Oscillospiraceae bacterium]
MAKKKARRKHKKKMTSTYIGGIVGGASGIIISVCLGAFVFGGVSISNKPKKMNPKDRIMFEGKPKETVEVETETEEETIPPEIAAILAGAPVVQAPEEPREINPEKPMIALTFDDGPNVGSTEKILDVLEKNNVHATFFHVGDCINEDTEHIVKREFELGCDVGNHSQSHENLRDIPLNTALASLKSTDTLIEKCIKEKPIFVRPPYGAYSDTLREEDGRMFIYWSVDTNDWKSRNADAVYNTIMQYASDGDIILMHDIYDSTADAVKRAVPALLERGYQLVTISELMEYRDFEYEDGMLLFNLHPTNPLYDSLHGTDTYDNPPATLPEEEYSTGDVKTTDLNN